MRKIGTSGDDLPTRRQSRVHPWGEVPPAALGTYDLKWTAILPDGEPDGERSTVRRLCPGCKIRHERAGVRISPHRFE